MSTEDREKLELKVSWAEGCGVIQCEASRTPNAMKTTVQKLAAAFTAAWPPSRVAWEAQAMESRPALGINQAKEYDEMIEALLPLCQRGESFLGTLLRVLKEHGPMPGREPEESRETLGDYGLRLARQTHDLLDQVGAPKTGVFGPLTPFARIEALAKDRDEALTGSAPYASAYNRAIADAHNAMADEFGHASQDPNGIRAQAAIRRLYKPLTEETKQTAGTTAPPSLLSENERRFRAEVAERLWWALGPSGGQATKHDLDAMLVEVVRASEDALKWRNREVTEAGIRDATLEEAAKVVDEVSRDGGITSIRRSAEACAREIRALKSKPVPATSEASALPPVIVTDTLCVDDVPPVTTWSTPEVWATLSGPQRARVEMGLPPDPRPPLGTPPLCLTPGCEKPTGHAPPCEPCGAKRGPTGDVPPMARIAVMDGAVETGAITFGDLKADWQALVTRDASGRLVIKHGDLYGPKSVAPQPSGNSGELPASEVEDVLSSGGGFSRLSPEPIHDSAWARKQVLAGRIVRRGLKGRPVGLEPSDSGAWMVYVTTGGEYRMSLEDAEATDWQVVE